MPQPSQKHPKSTLLKSRIVSCASLKQSKIWIASLLLFVCLASCNVASAQDALNAHLNTLLALFSGNPSVGIVVKNLDTGKILYALNANRSFVPGSTTKVLTATAALQFLGPQYQFPTSIAISGKVDQSVLNGDVYINFNADPSLQKQDLAQLLSQLSSKQIQTISGNVYINVGNAPTSQPAPGYMWDDQHFCYAAPNSTVVIDHNCFHFTLQPGETIGAIASLTSKNPLTFTSVNVQVRTQLDEQNSCDMQLQVDSQNAYQLTGCVPYQHPAFPFAVAVNNPRMLARQIIRQWLTQQHIKLTGQVLTSHSTPSAAVLQTHYSQSLAQLLRHTLKTSDNLYANNIFKTVGAVYTDQSANWLNGSKAVLDILDSMGIDTKQVHLVDGAGLSRYNRFSPELLLNILQYNYTHPKIGQPFFHALSIAGTDGTLKNFDWPIAQSSFHAKTGSMRSVACTVGYLHTPQGQNLAVVVMVNGIKNYRVYFALIHELLMTLAGLP
jgi:D-alanyl-D-alanine carboxypeptidase/D-alanyl-D-alanine-endopeptidase (penicillin-binding protein 4)